jgi:hypothetical protein
MDRRGFVRVASIGVLGAALSRHAHASLSRAVPVADLVGRSQHVMLGEPLDADSVWEELGGRKHIVSYTRVRVHELLAGADPKQDELLVRTLGGRVGDLGELVHGEARLTLGERSVLFVMPARDVLAVTAMAQGHYPLLRDAAGTERLRRSPEAAELLNEAGSAVKRFTGMQVPEARELIRRTVRP